MFKLGDFVKIKDSNMIGYISKISENKNVKKYHVNINDKIVIVDSDYLMLSDKPKQNTKTNRYNAILNSETKTLDTIMIRHQTVDEALYNLDKFIDNAICNNISQVKIIHGKNGGILRREVHKYLENNPQIKDHRLGGYYEGSYGVTIAFLK